MAAPRSDVFDDYDETREFVRQAFVTGTAVTLPLIVTVIVLGFIVDFVSKQLNPVVGLFTSLTGVDPASETGLKVAAVVVLLALVFLVGAVSEYRPGNSELVTVFDTLVARVPGVGSLYRSLDEMSSLLLDNDTDSFREVKLVEFPAEGSFAVAFLTADTPEVIESAVDREGMVTLFLPMAPNPVMGGHVLHVAEERVFDVDISVEEGIQSIVTSGVATGHRTGEELPEDVLDRIQRRVTAADIVAGVEEYATDASAKLEETAQETISSARSRAEAGPGGPDDSGGGDRGEPDGETGNASN